MDKIVTLCVNPCVDHVGWADRVESGRKVRIERDKYAPGGGGINVAQAAHQLGVHALAIYPAAGETGQLLQHLLADDDIEQRMIDAPGRTRVNTNIFEASSGETFRLIMPGPPMTPETASEIVKAVAGAVQDGSHVVISGSMPAETPAHFIPKVLNAIQQSGGRVIVDTSGEALRQSIEQGVFMIKPNQRELAQLTERDLPDDEAVEHAALALVRERAVEVVVVSLGGAGAMLATADGVTRIHAPQVDMQSPIGAGDSMVAGIVTAMIQGRSLQDSVSYGVAAGAAAVMQPAMELCRKHDADELFKAI
ncbi:MAG: 1-phosphofructokinase family hexose kinase [Phycisphaeraceae bacterium]